MLSWEFPPLVVGGLGNHVGQLCGHLPDQGVELFLITPTVEGCPSYEDRGKMSVYRIGEPMPSEKEFRQWISGFNADLIAEAIRINQQIGGFDLVHAHDWSVGNAARVVSRILGIPLVTTIHATESGRNRGLHNPFQEEIHEIEQNLIRESDRVICCSRFMQEEVAALFNPEIGKTTVIPNGVNPNRFVGTRMPGEVAEKYGIDDDDHVIFNIGRLVSEKGVAVLINAFNRFLGYCPRSKLIIGGKGPQMEELVNLTATLGLGNRVLFSGFIPDDIRDMLFCRADMTVFPSLYEPFGIVALEAMAAGTPVIVSRVGGLAEIVVDEITGLQVPKDDADALAEAMVRLTQETGLSARLSREALKTLEYKYNWRGIAATTAGEYQQVLGQIVKDGVSQ